MDDVNKDSASQTQGEGNTQPESQPTETNQESVVEKPDTEAQAEVPERPTTQERTIPYSRFAEVNKAKRDAERALASERATKANAGFDPNDLEQIRNHPYVQQLEVARAEGELKAGAEEILQRFPQIPAAVRKAILRNPRGYVQPQTTDVPNALLDIEDYLLDVSQELETEKTTAPKQFQVAGTNVPKETQASSIPAEVSKILAKPLTEWTKEDDALIKEHAASLGVRTAD